MKRKTWLALVGLSVLVLSAGATQAGTITLGDFTSDATSGIDSSNTYTHVLNFGISSSPTATVNKVVFDNAVNAAGTGYSLTGSHNSFNTSLAAGNYGAQDGAKNLFFGFRASSGMTLTLTGLTAGQAYDTRVYFAPYNLNGTRIATLTFDGDSGSASAIVHSEDGYSTKGGHYISYAFTADSGQATVAITSGWHLYAVSNELVPEPASMSLLALGGLVAFKRRR